MSRLASAAKMAKVIQKLRADREKAAAEIAEIDAFFSSLGFGTSAPVVGRRGRPPGSGRKSGNGRRKRGSFATTGEESVLGFVKGHGKPSAADVNKHWQGEGRGGKADNALSKLVKDGKLKRQEVKGERGGRYVLA